jgi:hypothetical protein
VSGKNTGVNDVGTNTRTSAIVVDVVGGRERSMGNTRNTPGRAALGDIGVDGNNSILLNKLDLYKSR